jgi:glutamate formiminotransferase
VATARAIAREVRTASSGLKGVKALGVVAHGRVQLTMNITDFEVTSLSQVFRKVAALALRHKAAPVSGEIIGLLPEAACERDSDWMRQLSEFDPQTKILERRLAAPLAWPGETPAGSRTLDSPR